jgi:hypothetical protein
VTFFSLDEKSSEIKLMVEIITEKIKTVKKIEKILITKPLINSTLIY